MILGMVVLSISFAFVREVGSDKEGGGGAGGGGVAAVMSLIGMTGFCCAYALSLGNVPWIVQSEVNEQALSGALSLSLLLPSKLLTRVGSCYRFSYLN